MYGDVNTPNGYWSMRSNLPGVAPSRGMAIWQGISSGKAGETLSSYQERINPSGAINNEAVKEYVKGIEGYVSSLSSSVIEMSDAVFNAASFLEKMLNKMSDGIKMLAE